MRRQRGKARPLYRYDRYKGARRQRGQTVLTAAVVCAAAGLALVLLRGLGIRFSGFLLLALAAALTAGEYLRRWARRSRAGRRCQLVFRAALALVLIPLALIEIFVIHEGCKAPPEESAGAVIVLGAGVNGTEPSLSLKTRLDAALDYLTAHPDIPAVLTGGRGYGEEISEAQCMYDYLTARGVAAERLILEESASNTAENFALSRPLLEEAGVDPAADTVAVVTNDFHLARAGFLAARNGYGDTVGVGAALPWAHLEINYYLREAFAMVKSFLLD